LSRLWVGDAGFELCYAAVGEAVVLAGGGQFVGEASNLGVVIANSAFEGEVLAGQADPVVFGPSGVQFADLPEEFGDLVALAQNLGVRGLERVFAVEGSLAPGGFQCLLLGFPALDSPPGAWAVPVSMIFLASGLS
jgi:hypothetical protein